MKFSFADCESGKVTIFGAPYDLTSSFRPGSRFAPQSIRRASREFESFIPELGVDLGDYEIADEGDLELSFDLKKALKEVESLSRDIRSRGSIPLMLGGEHSLTLGNLRPFKGASVLVFDAHLDYRADYRDADGHACVLRRMIEEDLAEKIVVLGARSFSREVFDQVKGSKIEFYPPRDAEKGVGRFLPGEKLYISIDVDVIDPAYAPGVANPEPGGISPYLMTLILSKVIESCDVVALDLVEISPPFDHGDITSILGAWIVKEVMGRILSK